jgi:hypothetical protein
MATSGVCYSWKQEIFEAGHCFQAILTQSATTHGTASYVLDGMATTAGISVGMAITGGEVAANAVVASITSAAALVMSLPGTSTGSTASTTFTGDQFYIALVKASPATTFGPTMTNIGTPGSSASSVTNLGTDETTNSAGSAYTSGGFALTNVAPSVPVTPGTVATISYSPNPSWTSASFSTTAGIIYNYSTRVGAGATTPTYTPFGGRTVAVYDFGGTQTVSAGTLTLVMPTNDGNNAILRIA